MSSIFDNTKYKDFKFISKSQRSSCAVAIFRWDKPDVIVATKLTPNQDIAVNYGVGNTSGLTERETLLIDNEIINCFVSKNKGESSGSFSITLKRGLDPEGLLDENFNYLKSINSGDWVAIFMKKSGEIVMSPSASSGLKCVGIIENIRKNETVNPETGAVTLEIVITGKDFGKVFESNLYFNPILYGKSGPAFLGAAFMKKSSEMFKGSSQTSTNSSNSRSVQTPDAIMKSIISFYMGGDLASTYKTNQPWYIPQTLAKFFGISKKIKGSHAAFVDILNQDRIGLHNFETALSRAATNAVLQSPATTTLETKGGKTFQSTSPLLGKTWPGVAPASGNVWSVMQYYANLGVNEMYPDLVLDEKTGTIKPSLIFRQLPFSSRKTSSINPLTLGGISDSLKNEEKTYYLDLPRYIISSSDILFNGIGKSDHDRINYILTVPRSDLIQGTEVQYSSIINTPSIQRYGLKMLQVQTPYIFDSQRPAQTYCADVCSLIADWFLLSHMFYNGSVVVDGFDYLIEVGNNLEIKDSKELYHVEGYTHNYTYNTEKGGTVFFTELRLSRGVRLLDRDIEFMENKDTELSGVVTSALTTTVRNVSTNTNKKKV